MSSLPGHAVRPMATARSTTTATVFWVNGCRGRGHRALSGFEMQELGPKFGDGWPRLRLVACGAAAGCGLAGGAGAAPGSRHASPFVGRRLLEHSCNLSAPRGAGGAGGSGTQPGPRHGIRFGSAVSVVSHDDHLTCHGSNTLVANVDQPQSHQVRSLSTQLLCMCR